MGKPGRPRASHRAANTAPRRGDTRGTETSKYPQEEKSNENPQVAASENGRAQTGQGRGSRTCSEADDGSPGEAPGRALHRGRRTRTRRGGVSASRDPEYGGTRGILPEASGTIPKG